MIGNFKEMRAADRIHRLLRVFLLTGLFIMISLQPGFGENLLRNGSFEEKNPDGLPADWITDAYVFEEGYTVFSLSEEDSVDGDRAAFIRNIGANDARFSQKVTVKPESLYCFSGYIRTEDVHDGRGANLSLEGLYTFSESVSDTSDGWQYIEWYGETGPDQYSVTLFARLGGYSGESTGKAWFDDLKLEEVSETPDDIIASRWYQQKTISYYDDEEEEGLGGEDNGSPAWPRLMILGLFYTLIAILLIQWLKKREHLQDIRDHDFQDHDFLCSSIFFAGLLAAFFLRIILSYFIEGYMVDVNCFVSWGNTMANYGPAEFYPKTSFCDYPPAYTYILGLNALVCRALPNTDEGMIRVVFRFFPSLCDLLSCIVLYRFFHRNQPRSSPAALTAALLLLAFHPVAVMNSAAWGQMDSVLALLLILVAIWATEGKWQFCLPCYMLAVLVKPQALMLGFLGLTALIMIWIREEEARKEMIRGLLASVGVLLLIVVPFSLHQDPFWIVSQYAETLSSYPHATVNTANYYYLFGGNWSSITRTAPAATSVFLSVFTAGFGIAFWLLSSAKERRKALPAGILSALFSLYFLLCSFLHASWSQIGTAAMVFAFVIVLSLYIRKGAISFLPYMGGLLFLILYVFGIKMHERYIFPAFLLLSLAYGLHRDRRILIVLLTVTCTVFLNEGIVLDNSIRLGSAMGHLNQDTSVLAMILSAVNCLITLYAVFLGLRLSLASSPEPVPLRRIKDPPMNRRLQWTGKDTVLISLIVSVYSLISFSTLGSMKAPQTAWTSTEYAENIILDLGEEQDGFMMLYFARVSRYDFSVAVSSDGISWQDETWAQMDPGQCWKWKYVTDSYQDGSGTRQYGNARHWFSGRYVRITAHQINLALCEVLFRDGQGNRLPVLSAVRQEGDPESSLYSDPGNLIDEQDTFEGLPVLFRTEASEASGEENPAVAQPSWWNSTYFDEIYHARTAWEFLQGSSPYETSHPPLGKILMSWGVAIFGMTPFGWRFAGALAGVVMLLFIYLVVRQMTKSTGLASFAAGLLALDCMHLTQTQIATIDSFPVLFILMSFFFMLRFLQTDWSTEKQSRMLIDLGCCGISFGLAVASKWIGLYAGVGLAILFFWHGFRVLRQKNTISGTESPYPVRTAQELLHTFLILCFWCILFFVLIPAAIYLCSYIPYFAYRHFSSFSDYLEAVLSSQQGMFNYHSTPGLGMDHPFYSPWYEWPVIGKPMFYSTKQYIFNDDLSFSIFCFGNPVIWWLGIPAILFCVFLWIRNREEKTILLSPEQNGFATLDTNLVFLLIGILAQYLPWTLVPRGTYIYHYFASVPFLIIALALCVGQIRLHSLKAGFICGFVLIFLSFAAFLLFFPYASGILAPVSWLEAGKGLLKIWY